MKAGWGIFLILVSAWTANAAVRSEYGVVLLPMNCSELLPDNSLYSGFLESVGKASAISDAAFSKRIFKVLAIRDRVQEQSAGEGNPIDTLIRRTLCYFREQKDPLRVVPFDDANFKQFLKSNFKDLEKQVEESVFQIELEKHQRKLYETKLQKLQQVTEKVRRQASAEANATVSRLSKSAQKKAMRP